MTIRCIYCKESLVLNIDSEQNHKLKTDPRQQMRQHVETKHMKEIMEHSRKLGWLQDMLFFDCPEEPEKWKGHIDKLIEHHFSQHS